MNRLVIVGTGEFSKQILEIALIQNKYNVIGFYDDFSNDDSFQNIAILGKITDIENDFINKKFDFIFYGIGYNHLPFKHTLIEKYWKVPMATIIHPSALIESQSTIESGVLIYPLAYIGQRVHLSKGVVINVGTKLSHDIKIDSCSFLSVGVNSGGNVKVGKRVFIGIGAIIKDSVSICDDVLIGAGTLIIKSIIIPDTYFGSPARKMIKND